MNNLNSMNKKVIFNNGQTVLPVIQEKRKNESDINLIQAVKADFEPKANKLYLRPFSKYNRKLIFVLLFCLNIIINMDHGIVPAGITSIQNDLKINSVQIGMLG